MTSDPLISVVIPTRGRADLLKRAIESVYKQTFTNYQIVVVVDGPDTETESMLQELKNSKLEYIINPKSLGGSEARNVGVNHARGNWIAFLDDDDEWFPNKLEEQYKIAKQKRDKSPIIYSRLIASSPKADYEWPRRGIKKNEHISEYLFTRRSLFQGEGLIQTSTIFVSRDLMIALPFKKGLKRHQDWDWLLRAAKTNKVEFVFCPLILTKWYIEEKRKSVSKIGDWKYSLNWTLENDQLFTPRGLSSFVMTVVSSISAREGNYGSIFKLLKISFKHGKPSFFDCLIFSGMWLVPQNIRHTIRKLTNIKSKLIRGES